MHLTLHLTRKALFYNGTYPLVQVPMNRGMLAQMLLVRRILIRLRMYIHDSENRYKYAGSQEWQGKETSKSGFIGYLRHERHLRVDWRDRIAMEYFALESRLGIQSKIHSGASGRSFVRAKLWQERMENAILWAEERRLIGIDSISRDKIRLLPASSRFIELLPFANEVAKEYGPLKSILTGTGIGAGLGTIIALIYTHWPR